MIEHIVGFISELLGTILKYVSILLILVFDSIIFSYPMIMINNYILIKAYGVPELNYLQGVGIIFLFKLFAVLWNSVGTEPNGNVEYINEEQEN